MSDVLPAGSEDSNRSSARHILLFSALASAIASLVIGIVSLSRRRQPALANRFGEYPPGDQNQPPGAVGRYPQAQAPMDRRAPKPALNSTFAPATTGSQPDGEILAQGGPGQPGETKPASSTRWGMATKYVVGVGLFLAMLFIVYFSRSVLPMIVFAALLAFVVQPLVKFFQRRFEMKRGSSVGVVYLLVVVAMILIPLVVIPALVQAINDVLLLDWQTIGQEAAFSLQTMAQNVSSVPVIGPLLASSLDAAAQLLSGATALETPAPVVVNVSMASVGGQLANTLGRLARILGPLISAVVSLVFMLLISLRMSLAVDEMRDAYPKLVPQVYKGEVTGLIERIINIWVSFLRGQLSLMVVMGFLTYLLNLLLGTPHALFLGLLAGILEIIPNLGPVLATIPAVLFALVLGSSHLPVSNFVFAIIVIIGYVLLSALENQVLVPKILGDAVNLPPLVVIIGCVVGGATFGLLGVLLATPVISTGKEIFGYLYNKILEPPPEPEKPEQRPSITDTLKGLARRVRLPFRRGEQNPPPDQTTAAQIEGQVG